MDKDEWMRQGWAFASAACDEPKPTGHIAREHAATLDVPTFVEKYEKPNLPVLIAGCADEWKAVKKAAWHPKKLFETYRHRRFKCGEDDEGYPVKMKLKYFLRYMVRAPYGACARS
ncbi:hypothetical protein EON67_00890 [archaeon]|nr:MAG: hypothetical protein EON67_00890 [archaeon]